LEEALKPISITQRRTRLSLYAARLPGGAGRNEVTAEGIRYARLALARHRRRHGARLRRSPFHLPATEAASAPSPRALSLNGSCATALIGARKTCSARDQAPAEEYANRALRLSPFDQFSYEGHIALRRAVSLGRYADAAECLRMRCRRTHASGSSTCCGFGAALAGRIDEAQRTPGSLEPADVPPGA
jgi:hypothetical protein